VLTVFESFVALAKEAPRRNQPLMPHVEVLGNHLCVFATHEQNGALLLSLVEHDGIQAQPVAW